MPIRKQITNARCVTNSFPKNDIYKDTYRDTWKICVKLNTCQLRKSYKSEIMLHLKVFVNCVEDFNLSRLYTNGNIKDLQYYIGSLHEELDTLFHLQEEEFFKYEKLIQDGTKGEIKYYWAIHRDLRSYIQPIQINIVWDLKK
jgi:hypothetical protein